MVDRRPKNKRSRERERERETKGVAFVSLYFARILWMRDCLSREEEEDDEEEDENRDFSFAEKERKMGNSIAMAEQVLEQEEPVRFLSLSLSVVSFRVRCKAVVVLTSNSRFSIGGLSIDMSIYCFVVVCLFVLFCFVLFSS